MNSEIQWIEQAWARMELENPTQTILTIAPRTSLESSRSYELTEGEQVPMYDIDDRAKLARMRTA